MIDVIIQALGQFGFAVADGLVDAVVKLIRAEGDLSLAYAALKFACATNMDQAEINKRGGTVQTLEHERMICREDLIRVIPIASADQTAGLIGWAISHAAMYVRPSSMED
jgi:hypothetical protein